MSSDDTKKKLKKSRMPYKVVVPVEVKLHSAPDVNGGFLAMTIGDTACNITRTDEETGEKTTIGETIAAMGGGVQIRLDEWKTTYAFHPFDLWKAIATALSEQGVAMEAEL